MKTVARYVVKFPTWALSYVVNDDMGNLTETDMREVDNFLQQFSREAEISAGDVIVSPNLDSENYFTWHPAFGLACDVIDTVILIVKPELT